MSKPDPLQLYLDLRRQLLGQAFDADGRFSAQDVADATGYSKAATLGVLNALTTDGYLQKHPKTFSQVRWTPRMLDECAARLSVFVGISASRVAGEGGRRLQKTRELIGYLDQFHHTDERYFVGLMEGFSVLLRSGDRKALSEIAHRVIPQSFYRLVWNLLGPSGTEPFVGPAIATFYDRAAAGDRNGCEEALRGLWSGLGSGLEAVASANPRLQLDADFLAGANNLREHDVRGRTLTLTHPAFPSYLPIREATARRA